MLQRRCRLPELIHVHQNHEDRLHDIKTDNINADKHLENLEREAYETGNIMFRSWTNNITENKDPFGLNQFAREIAEEVINEPELYATVLSNLGLCYFRTGNPKALDYLNKGLKIKEERGIV